MQEAQARWDAQIREGKVRNVSTSEAGELVKDGWIMLDVRPPEETDKAGIIGSVEVPVFIPDTEITPGSLIKQMSAFGMGGWWLGGTHMVPYNNFLPDVLSKVPKDANVIVGCQKGLRSLAACEQLSRAGYKNIAWVNGGFDTAAKGDLPVKGDVDIRYSGIGGLSAVVGWTEVQQQDNAGLGGGVENVLKLVGVVVVLDILVFAYEQYQYMQGAN